MSTALDALIGIERDLGTHTFTADEIVTFAKNTIRSVSMWTRKPLRRVISVRSAPPVGIRQRCGCG